MIQQIVKPVLSEGVVVGFVRMGLAALCVAALLNGVRGGVAAAGPIMALLFIALYTLVLGDSREAAITIFASDRMLSAAEPGLSWRVALTVCRLVGAGIFWSFLTVDLIPAGGLLAMVPLGASAIYRLQHWLHRVGPSQRAEHRTPWVTRERAQSHAEAHPSGGSVVNPVIPGAPQAGEPTNTFL